MTAPLDGGDAVALTILGSGGWMPTPGRQTCSALLRRGRDALLLDAGTGLAHLPHNPGLLAGVDRVAILLTHFHADHVVGLCYAGGLGLPVAPTVFGPGRDVYGVATESLLGSLVGYPTTHAGLGELWPDVRDLDGTEAELAGFAVELRVQHHHTAPTLAIRVEDRVAYVTDTGFDADTAPFVEGVGTLVHEGWWHRGHVDCPETHSSARDAGRTAAEAGAQRLLLMHLHPMGDHAALLAEARDEHGDVSLAHDLLSTPLAA